MGKTGPKNGHHSIQTKEIISNKVKKLWKNLHYRKNMTEKHKGQVAWNKGKQHLKISGNKHPQWKGGISKDKEHLKYLRRAWKSKNYGKVLFSNLQRRARKLNADGQHTLGEWENLKTQYNWTCPCCKRSEPEIKLTEDHIIPISKGGSDNIENIQPLCRSCNSRKQTKIIRYS